MYLEQDYKFHFLSFLGREGFKISNGKKKTIWALRTVRCSVQVQIQIIRGLHQNGKFEVILSTKKN